MVTIIYSIRNSPSPGNFLSTWMTVTFAILAAQPICMALNFEAVLRLKPICAHGWIAWITSVSPPLPSYGFTNTWFLPNFHALLHHLTWAFRLPSIFKLWLPPISNAGQACHTQQMSPFFTLVAQSEPAWELRILLPSGSRCRLCAWTFCNNPLTVVAPACMTDFSSARNGGHVGMHQWLSMHAHWQS